MTKVSIGRLLWVATLIGIVSLTVSACSGTGGSTEQQQPNTDVEPLTGDRAEMQVALPNGTLPCGLGQVEWGNQVFKLEEYPSCQPFAPAVTVYCLNDQAEWTNDALTITEVSMGAITLDAQREGICGIFPTQ